MEKKEYILDKLTEYGRSDAYPFHMPGHKRQTENGFASGFPNPFSIDITEIDGFDNLHHPEGILKASMEWAAELYGADRTYYLINGSSCGILSAICGTVRHGGKILMGRNCHKSAYHGVLLGHLEAIYVYPQTVREFGVQGGYLPENIEKLLKSDSDIQAVLVVSPTYDGIVSDIGRIAEIVHGFGLPLIVDEAHGAHFPFAKGGLAPVSALELGADVVIQSLHKTLPSFTQTAVMHVRDGLVNWERIDRYVHVFQSSSPSYILMAGIENCLRWMEEEGRRRMPEFYRNLRKCRKILEGMSCLKLLPEGIAGRSGVFGVDETKIVVSCRNAGITGPQLEECLRRDYHLEMEMCGPDYVTAITTVADTNEGLSRLVEALMDLDGMFKKTRVDMPFGCGGCEGPNGGEIPFLDENRYSLNADLTIADAVDAEWKEVLWEKSAGMVSGEFVYVYPPGIPIVAPGELLTEPIIKLVTDYRRHGLPVQGMLDESGRVVRVVV